MTRFPHLFYDLLDLAAAMRSDRTTARFVRVISTSGRMHCAVTSAAAPGLDPDPDPTVASHPLVGAALQEAAASLARELIDRYASRFLETGGRGLVEISADGAVRLDLTMADGDRVRETVDLDRLRVSAMSHGTNRAVCLAAAFSDDSRFPAWNSSEQAQRDWMRAASSIDPEGGPDQEGVDAAAKRIVTSFRPVNLSSDRIADLIRTRLYPDLCVSQSQKAPVPDIPEGLGTAPAWLPLNPLEAERLYVALEGSTDPVLAGVHATLRTLLSDVSADEAFRAAAVEKYAGKLGEGELDFQADGMVSKGDEGAYVQAFLWVTNAEAGLEEQMDELADGPI